jgi:transposase-like protein
MTRSKLTDIEKTQIIALAEQPGATVASLADQFGVSTTTIRRILKTSSSPPLTSDSPVGESQEASLPLVIDTPSRPEKPRRRSRQRGESPEPVEGLPSTSSQTQEPLLSNPPVAEIQGELPVEMEVAPEFEAESDSDASDLELEDDDLGDLDDDLDLEETLEDDESPELDEGELYSGSRISPETRVQVLPLAEAAIPRTCYLVIDRSAELITRPLKEFGDLGQIPPEEIQEKTLPVFDNHRVARRFSNRMQRVIKLPDGTLLQKTGAQLYAKGITRLLINGQVYSL